MKRSERVARIVGAKKKLRDHAVGELARAHEAVAIAEERAKFAGTILDYAIARLTQSGALRGEELAAYAEQVRHAEDLLVRAETDLKVVVHDRDSKTEVAREAHREVRALETAGERYRAAEDHEAMQRETREIEDVTNARSAK
jgi:hypothetical protein